MRNNKTMRLIYGLNNLKRNNMKKLITLIIITTILFVGCKSHAPYEIDKSFSTKEGKIYRYDTIHVATYINLEYEYYLGVKILEISVQQEFMGVTKLTDEIISYLTTKHPNAKLEVKIPNAGKVYTK